MDIVSTVLTVIVKIEELRGQINGQKVKCYKLINRCSALRPSLQKISSSKKKSSSQSLQRLLDLLNECLTICEKFVGRHWILTAMDVWCNSSRFDELHDEVTAIAGDLNLEFTASLIQKVDDVLENANDVTEFKTFLQCHGLNVDLSKASDLAEAMMIIRKQKKANTVNSLMKSSLELCALTSVNPNRDSMELETLDNTLQYQPDKGSQLGKGAYGTVYNGRYRKKTVAVKVFQHVDEKLAREITREIRVMGNATHANVIALYGYSLEKHIIVMEIATCSIFDVISGKKTNLDNDSYLKNMSNVVQCFVEILSGLRYLHYHDIIHRDIKPHNILLVVDSKKQVVAKISDFGLATMSSMSLSATRGTGVFGSLAYMAPEILTVPAVYSNKSDMYAVGITFHQILSRQDPYPTGTTPASLHLDVAAGGRPRTEWCSDYPKDPIILAAIGDKDSGCLHHNPQMRMDAGEFLMAIRTRTITGSSTSNPMQLQTPDGSSLSPDKDKSNENYVMSDYYIQHLLAGFLFCLLSMIFISLSIDHQWGKLHTSRRLSTLQTQNFSFHPDAIKSSRRLRSNMVSMTNHLSFNSSLRRLVPLSISWPLYVTVGEEKFVSLCGGHTIEVSMCASTSDTGISCSGDSSLELKDYDTLTRVAYNDNYCGKCPTLYYQVPSGSYCSNYVLSAACKSGTCSGTAGVRVTTSACSTYVYGPLASTNTYPLFSCSLAQQYTSLICSADGQWSILNAGIYRDQCFLKGSGYGCTYNTGWSTDSGYYSCIDDGNTAMPTKTPTRAPTSVPTRTPTPRPTRSPTISYGFTFSLSCEENFDICEALVGVSAGVYLSLIFIVFALIIVLFRLILICSTSFEISLQGYDDKWRFIYLTCCGASLIFGLMAIGIFSDSLKLENEVGIFLS